VCTWCLLRPLVQSLVVHLIFLYNNDNQASSVECHSALFSITQQITDQCWSVLSTLISADQRWVGHCWVPFQPIWLGMDKCQFWSVLISADQKSAIADQRWSEHVGERQDLINKVIPHFPQISFNPPRRFLAYGDLLFVQKLDGEYQHRGTMHIHIILWTEHIWWMLLNMLYNIWNLHIYHLWIWPILPRWEFTHEARHKCRVRTRSLNEQVVWHVIHSPHMRRLSLPCLFTHPPLPHQTHKHWQIFFYILPVVEFFCSMRARECSQLGPPTCRSSSQTLWRNYSIVGQKAFRAFAR